MNGGWYSFGRQLGKGGWGRSLFRDTLPVECLEGDDLLESTESFPVRICNEEHSIIRGIDFSKLPPLLGFNKTRPYDDCEIIVEIQFADCWYHLLAARSLGQGRATAWTSGASPHWGINLVKWPHYDQFWSNVFTAEY